MNNYDERLTDMMAEGVNIDTAKEILAMDEMAYAERVAQLEAEGLTTSDAQAVADAEGLA
jgi:hypothetical protein